MSSIEEMVSRNLPPLPEQPTFDFFQHEYWRITELYKELVKWQIELERWEQSLTVQSHGRNRRNHNNNRNRNRGQPHSSVPPSQATSTNNQ